MAYFAQTKGLLSNPNIYVVVASYGRPGSGVHYLSAGPTDRNSIEAVVAWLKAYRANPQHPPA